MVNVFEYLLFILFTIYIFIKALAYAIYEIKVEKNKFGGISIIFVSLSVCILSNIVLLLN